MRLSREIRRCALQAMYQFDRGNDQSPELVRATLDQSPGDDRAHQQGFELALAAWEARQEADTVFAELTPDWPLHRQPVIDRNLLRLAYHEMTHIGTPGKVAINEAVELAREFSTDKSPLFINGVLDRVYRSLRDRAASEAASSESEGT